jgi:nitrite reductase/ring-hydroxylating ferredoxin subunit
VSDGIRGEGDGGPGDVTGGPGPAPAPIPSGLAAPGSTGATFRPLLAAADLPPGALRRVTVGDLDVLLAHTASGLVATDDRCPHMSAPLSLGRLDGCVVDCPLHRGRFDLCSGEVVQLPTTGGLDADGGTHAPWSPAGMEPKPDPPGSKGDARRLTRTRRLRFYPVRVVDGSIEVALPPEVG